MLIRKKKEETVVSLSDFGEILLYLVFFNVIINVVLYIAGQQPESFDIFQYLIEKQLPNAWYMILLYGILIQLTITFRRTKK